MSEPRFYITDTGLGLDTKSDEMYSFGNEEDFCRLFDKLNEQQATIGKLQQKYDKLCIEIANIYSKYIFMKEFSEDTNPNEAVKYVLRELMQKTKEARR